MTHPNRPRPQRPGDLEYMTVARTDSSLQARRAEGTAWFGRGAVVGLLAWLTSVQGRPRLVMLVLPWAGQRFPGAPEVGPDERASTPAPIPASAGLGALQPGHSHLHSQTLSTSSSPIKSTPTDPLLSASSTSSSPSSAFYPLHSPLSPSWFQAPMCSHFFSSGSGLLPNTKAWPLPPSRDRLSDEASLTVVWHLYAPPAGHPVAGGKHWGPGIGRL